MSKYNSRKTVIDGITFDSKKEAKRYVELKKKQDEGEITDLRLQVPFELVPSFTIEIDAKKRRRRNIRYIADFVYYENGQKVVEDVKGRKTDIYKLKKKLFEYKYKVSIKET